MQDFSQRASAKTTTTNRLLPTSDHVSTSVHIYITLEIIQKEERMVKINSPTPGGGGGELTFTKKYYYITIDLPQKIIRIQNKFVDRTSRLFQQKKQSHRKFMHLTCLNASSLRTTNSFPSPTLIHSSPTLLSPPPPTTGTVLTHLESK